MILLAATLFLLLLSAFFSGAETAVMSLDRYQVKSLVDDGNLRAVRLLSYLEHPERFLSIVLLGNTFANILAASCFTLWVVDYFGDVALFPGTMALSLFVLLFCEMLPKSIAARMALKVCLFIIHFIRVFEVCLYPLLVLIRFIMREIIGKQFGLEGGTALDANELRGVLRVAIAGLPRQDRDMLEGVLDLRRLTIEEVMLPKHLVKTVDLDKGWDEIFLQISSLKVGSILVTRGGMDQEIVGVLRTSDLLQYIGSHAFNVDALLTILTTTCYVPEGTLLRTQLSNFQKSHHEIAVVVDEYGQTIGLLEVHDIVEEVVGHYAQRRAVPLGAVRYDGVSGYWVRADVKVRDLNRYLGWEFPDDHATTLGGLFLHTLERIPDGPCACLVSGYKLEAVDVRDKRLALFHIAPR